MCSLSIRNKMQKLSSSKKKKMKKKTIIRMNINKFRMMKKEKRKMKILNCKMIMLVLDIFLNIYYYSGGNFKTRLIVKKFRQQQFKRKNQS